ncbi:AbrB/MazE/SpoVT family DNA-binding domain-containing protein [Parerythrobacter lacustris]|uniref:AbrB/MazE/SpoVT family DNA-binding domain-containing protein n=1 Tax=Parerythrobacter lacustris TaxID=2969984 RepID=A0ABT1XT85_9SPHN|nr:AbrB/MazE/SpoVT family DNA-binding domain-containing protein [Parerythrobacter lacustris]MCR2834837.1 AbrB/MazE/SpoVT family DNA-binding domain-containing protein [Parerythrobacter lacustris]
MRYETNMTVKGQITVPKDVRDQLGLKPGQKVQIEMSNDGDVRILRASPEAKHEARLARVREVQAAFKAQDPMSGMSNADWFAAVRGPEPEV